MTQRSGLLDAVDEAILRTLRSDGRISISALAEHVGISRTNAYARLESLTERGVITGFAAQVEPNKVGLGVAALVFLSVNPDRWHAVRDRLFELPDIEYAAVTTGEHDLMCLVREPDVPSIYAFVTGTLASLPEVKSLVTVLLLDEVLNRPFLLPSDLPEYEPQETLGKTSFERVSEGRGGLAASG